MKRIGFIDYFLDEWHANNYPAWIRDSAAAMGLDCDVAYAWAEIDKQGGMDTESWCKHNNVQRLSTIEQLVEKSDYIIVLSPDNPEHHEKLSKLPLMSRKPVYIDKTFSPDLATGIRIFETAEKYGTPMFSTSALRFAQELSKYPDTQVNRDNLEYVATLGPGRYDNYSIHQYEMIVSLMGTGARRIKSISSQNGRFLAIEYADDRHSSLLQMNEAPFQVSMQLKNGEGIFVSQCSDTFTNLINEMLKFFNTGKVPVPKEDTLEIMALIEAGYSALENYNTWINIPVY